MLDRVLFFPIISVPYEDMTKKGINKGDYLVDLLYHGFKKEFHTFEYHDMSHTYKIDYNNLSVTGHKGYFSIYERLNESYKLQHYDSLWDDYYDYVVMPIHHSCRGNRKVIEENISYIQDKTNAKIAVICGDENPNEHLFLADRIDIVFFKCELTDNVYKTGRVFPVSYCIPRENIIDEVRLEDKELDFMPLIPTFLRRGLPHEDTYIYTDEDHYLLDYRRSYFGFTCKKGGWDLLRHYEMLSQGCLPYFTDVENLPKHTMFKYPRHLCSIIKMMKGVYPNWKNEYISIGSCVDILNTTGHFINHNEFSKDFYLELANCMLEYTKKHLTTQYMARHIVNTLYNVYN